MQPAAIAYSGSRPTVLSQPAFEQCTLVSVRADRPTSAIRRRVREFPVTSSRASPRGLLEGGRFMMNRMSRSRLVGLWFAAVALIVIGGAVAGVRVGLSTAAYLLTMS